VTPKGSMQIGGLGIPGATKNATATVSDKAERARRFVAMKAVDAVDLALLLEVLGLVPDGMVLTVDVP